MFRFTGILLLLLLTSISSSRASGQTGEPALFDQKGKPVAYIDEKDGFTIYLWSGIPVAYMVSEQKELHVYGFNGMHLGWFEQGIMYNNQGYIVGFIQDALLMFTEAEPYKPIKKFAPVKLYRDVVPFKPVYRYSFSPMPLVDFLEQGIEQ
jgi:hypothetical protein